MTDPIAPILTALFGLISVLCLFAAIVVASVWAGMVFMRPKSSHRRKLHNKWRGPAWRAPHWMHWQ